MITASTTPGPGQRPFNPEPFEEPLDPGTQESVHDIEQEAHDNVGEGHGQQDQQPGYQRPADMPQDGLACAIQNHCHTPQSKG